MAISTSARQILVDQLKQWGLSELTKDLDGLIKSGLDAPAITVNLQNTQAYQKRFAGNEERRKKGLPVLSPAEYIAAENSYQSVLRGYGLPASFYDDREDFHKFIGNDVSPEELNDRAGIAQQIWLSKDAATRDVWRSFYGLSDGAAIAGILDPNKALPVIQRMANAARAGAAVESQGLYADKGRLEKYSDMGLSSDQIGEGFGKIAQTLADDQKIARRFGQQITQTDREKEVLEGNADAARKRASLYQSETALFQQKASAGDSALQRTRGGSF